MNTTQHGILALLRSAVNRTACPEPEGFSLEEALPLIRKHGLETLAYEGALYCGHTLAEEPMRRLLGRCGPLMLHAERQSAEIEQLLRAFDEAGIDHMPLKGCTMRPRYPLPHLRLMGDADILIRTAQYPRIRPILEGLGFREERESDHELVWKKDALYLELHKRLIPSYNRDYFRYFGDSWQLGTRSDGFRYTMTPEDEYIFLFTHFAKHYRCGGIGCRHVLDLWVMERIFPELDRAYIARELKKLSLDRFYRNMRRLLDHWFRGGPSDEITQRLSDYIFSSGSWGTAAAAAVAEEVRGRDTRPKDLAGFVRWILPGRDALQDTYTFLQMAPWLLPLAWICRWIRKLLFPRTSAAEHARRMGFVTEQSVRAFREHMHSVGLTFPFEK